jgi:hypothetical protein
MGKRGRKKKSVAWSDRRKWLMGTMSTLLAAIFASDLRKLLGRATEPQGAKSDDIAKIPSGPTVHRVYVSDTLAVRETVVVSVATPAASATITNTHGGKLGK